MIEKVLLLPFLRMTSGHHRVAESIQHYISSHFPNTLCKKIDLLHYSYGSFERFITSCYLQWIRRFPESYHYIYSLLAGSKSSHEKKHQRMYEYMFIPFMRRLLQEEQPDLIFCTHSLPSYLLDTLKRTNELNIPVINVYTDFFINNLWGIHHVDQHWISDRSMETYLLQNGVPERHIFMTGIPIHDELQTAQSGQRQRPHASKIPFTILISGGNLGVGGLENLLKRLGHSPLFRYVVLCGKNNRLYDKLTKLKQNPFFKPLPYIESPQEMDRIYREVDAVFCKPGGVTISECLHRRKPVFVFGTLPGQETYNLNILKQRGLIWDLSDLKRKYGSVSLELAVAEILQSRVEIHRWQCRVEQFKEQVHHWGGLLHQTMVSSERDQTYMNQFHKSI